MIKIVNGANIQGLDICMRDAMKVLGKVYVKYGQDLTITCGLNGEHSAGSWHYYGRAVDTRIHFWDDFVVEEVYEVLKKKLPSQYRIFNEGTHFHIDCPL